jgi:hypothetical protein
MQLGSLHGASHEIFECSLDGLHILKWNSLEFSVYFDLQEAVAPRWFA